MKRQNSNHDFRQRSAQMRQLIDSFSLAAAGSWPWPPVAGTESIAGAASSAAVAVPNSTPAGAGARAGASSLPCSVPTGLHCMLLLTHASRALQGESMVELRSHASASSPGRSLPLFPAMLLAGKASLPPALL